MNDREKEMLEIIKVFLECLYIFPINKIKRTTYYEEILYKEVIEKEKRAKNIIREIENEEMKK